MTSNDAFEDVSRCVQQGLASALYRSYAVPKDDELQAILTQATQSAVNEWSSIEYPNATHALAQLRLIARAQGVKAGERWLRSNA